MSQGQPFKTIELTRSGWLLVIAGGCALGFGLARSADLSPITAPFVGCGLLILAFVVFDRRRYRKGTATVLLALPRTEVDRILEAARIGGLVATFGASPKSKTVVPSGHLAVRCRRRDLAKFLEIVELHQRS